MIYWSKNIYSDSAISVIQKIFDNRNLFTVWEKTDILSGYYVVSYFNSEQIFHVSEARIDHVINNEIAYVKDVIIPNIDNIHVNFRKELNQFIHDKKQQQQECGTFAIIYYEYPSQTEMKISFFGEKGMVGNARKQLQHLLWKHEMKLINIQLDLKQVRVI